MNHNLVSAELSYPRLVCQSDLACVDVVALACCFGIGSVSGKSFVIITGAVDLKEKAAGLP
jgi:hypothetical protein